MEPLILLGLIVAAMLLMVSFRLLSHRRQREISHTRMEMQTRLLEKISTTEELRAYFDSGAARTLMESVAPEPRTAQLRIMIAAMIGTGLTAGGLCCFLATIAMRMAATEPRAINITGGFGLFLTGAGASCLIAAYVAYRLSRTWGLIGDRR